MDACEEECRRWTVIRSRTISPLPPGYQMSRNKLTLEGVEGLEAHHTNPFSHNFYRELENASTKFYSFYQFIPSKNLLYSIKLRHTILV